MNHKSNEVTNTKDETKARSQQGKSLISQDSPIFKEARVKLNAALGRTELSVHELLSLKAGSIVKLDVKLSDHADLWLNDARIARGEIVALDGHFAIKIVEIAQIK